MSRTVDLNADLGEDCGDDAAMLTLVTSANIAAGGHAGGGETLLRTLALTLAAGVAVGAHISYPDRENFGRTSLADSLSLTNLYTSLREQLNDFDAALAGRAPISHIKAHGALYNDMMVRVDIAGVFLDAIRDWERDTSRIPVSVMGLPDSILKNLATDRLYIREGFADRAYNVDGSLVSRHLPDAVHHDIETVIKQACDFILHERITTQDGSPLNLTVDSLCVHGDTPAALDMACAIRNTLESHNIAIGAR